jgi:hypothetical protein
VFWGAAVLALIAAGCCVLRGRRFVYDEVTMPAAPAEPVAALPEALVASARR